MPLESLVTEKGENADIHHDWLLKAEHLCSRPGRSIGSKNIF